MNPTGPEYPDMPVHNPEADRIAKGKKAEDLSSLFLVLLLFIVGLLCFFMPVFSYHIMLDLIVGVLVLYGLFLIFLYFYRGRSSRMDLLFGFFAIIFAGILLFNVNLPEWIIRVCFSWYCFGVSLVMLVQIVIHQNNGVKIRPTAILLSLIYGILGIILLLTHIVNTETLIRLFGVYFILLASRMIIGLLDTHSAKYKWKRGIYISLPTLLATMLPDAALRTINSKIRSGQDYGMEQVKRDVPAKLKVMVHIGEEGFQKVGHFTFAWKGIVYSYGNYDAKSERFFSLLGDGVYFTVPMELYIPALVKYEHNTLFEYTIQTTEEQDRMIESQLEALKERSVRWYCDLEREGTSRRLGHYESDYPCRLHYRTGAKFYKLKNGAFKTYWVAGDNCVLFSDVILGNIGADVLSLRGIVTPGAYFDYLENEYLKENSPIIERRVYSFAASQDGI